MSYKLREEIDEAIASIDFDQHQETENTTTHDKDLIDPELSAQLHNTEENHDKQIENNGAEHDLIDPSLQQESSDNVLVDPELHHQEQQQEQPQEQPQEQQQEQNEEQKRAESALQNEIDELFEQSIQPTKEDIADNTENDNSNKRTHAEVENDQEDQGEKRQKVDEEEIQLPVLSLPEDPAKETQTESEEINKSAGTEPEKLEETNDVSEQVETTPGNQQEEPSSQTQPDKAGEIANDAVVPSEQEENQIQPMEVEDAESSNKDIDLQEQPQEKEDQIESQEKEGQSEAVTESSEKPAEVNEPSLATEINEKEDLEMIATELEVATGSNKEKRAAETEAEIEAEPVPEQTQQPEIQHEQNKSNGEINNNEDEEQEVESDVASGIPSNSELLNTNTAYAAYTTLSTQLEQHSQATAMLSSATLGALPLSIIAPVYLPPRIQLLINTLPTLDNLATQLLRTVASNPYQKIIDLASNPDTPEGATYRDLTSLFEFTKRLYSEEDPF